MVKISQLITSQSYIDDKIVAEKIAAGDFEVQVSPAFDIDGTAYRVVMDGHHSLSAAIEAGVEPTYIEQTATDNDKIGLLKAGKIEDFLAVCWMDGDYHYVATGKSVW